MSWHRYKLEIGTKCYVQRCIIYIYVHTHIYGKYIYGNTYTGKIYIENIYIYGKYIYRNTYTGKIYIENIYIYGKYLITT